MAPSITPGLANQLAARSGRVPDAARVCVRDDVRRLETGPPGECSSLHRNVSALPPCDREPWGPAQSDILFFKIRPRGRNETLVGLDEN